MPREPAQAKHISHVQLELEALLRFFEKTGGPKGAWINDTGWTALKEAVEQTGDMIILRGSLEKQLPLFGVQWDRNHVVAIDLCANGLDGRLPKELATLRSLKQLKLRNNPRLRGPVPSAMYRMPRLQYCYLDGTKLENVLPHHDAHAFQITRLGSHGTQTHVATVSFATGSREANLTRWMADMTEAELFMVQTTLQARHKPHDVHEPYTPQRTASNTTGPERVAAAITLQRIYRARIARTQFRNFLKSLFPKHFDASTGLEYFVDSRTGESMWQRPIFVAKTPRSEGEDDSNQDLWQAFDDGQGNTYYWNSVTGESTWEPPAFLSRIYRELRDRYGAEKTDDERFELFFQDIDRDNTGSIDRNEFARLCGELGMAMSPKQINHVFDELDTSGDGELSREEIIAWLTRNF